MNVFFICRKVEGRRLNFIIRLVCFENIFIFWVVVDSIFNKYSRYIWVNIDRFFSIIRVR